MIVSHKFKCIIIQPRKTAGTSLTELFKMVDPRVEDTYEEYNPPVPPYNHQPASECRKIVGEEIWNSYYKFAFIREPFSWVRSYYMHERKAWWSNQHPTYKLVGMTLRWQQQIPLEGNIITPDNFLSLYTLMKWWYPPRGVVGQSSWFDEELDHIGIFENLRDEMKFLGTKLGFDYELMPHSNKSKSNTVQLHSDTYQLINILLREDIEFYEKYRLLSIEHR